MVESKGQEIRADETRSGPLKPPMLDLKARATGASDAKPGATKPESGMSSTKSAGIEAAGPAPSSAGFPVLASLGGGVLGLAAAYGLAWFGLWPSSSVPPLPPDPRLTKLEASVSELLTISQTTQIEAATQARRIDILEAAATEVSEPVLSAVPVVDPGEIAADLAALSVRLDALSADAMGGGIDEEEQRRDLTALGLRIEELAARIGTAEAELRMLDRTVGKVAETQASQRDDIGAVLQLPLIFSGLEKAFATGQPFDAELAALRIVWPQVRIAPAIANLADTGLPHPDMIAQRFQAVLLAMLMRRPVNPDAQWQDGVLDWFRSMIALRATGEIEGNTPDAVMSRLEGAIARRDFVSAEQLFESLPPAMKVAGADIGTQIALQAQATRLLAAVRAGVLAGEALP